jgi:hypothetical protein
MPRKKSVKSSAAKFNHEVDKLTSFLSTMKAGQSGEHQSWLYNYGIIRLYIEFEKLMLDVLMGAVNNDTTTLQATTGVKFPKHLTDEVCEFLITGTGYFDFKGRSGLIKTFKSFVPDSHYVVVAIKKPAYKEALGQLYTLRNYAAHESQSSKRTASSAVGSNLSSSGAWLRRQGRFEKITTNLKALANDLHASAPY